MQSTVGDPALYVKTVKIRIIFISKSDLEDLLKAGNTKFKVVTKSTLKICESKPWVYENFDFFLSK